MSAPRCGALWPAAAAEQVIGHLLALLQVIDVGIPYLVVTSRQLAQ